jgi:hypothetical protein
MHQGLHGMAREIGGVIHQQQGEWRIELEVPE